MRIVDIFSVIGIIAISIVPSHCDSLVFASGTQSRDVTVKHINQDIDDAMSRVFYAIVEPTHVMNDISIDQDTFNIYLSTNEASTGGQIVHIKYDGFDTEYSVERKKWTRISALELDESKRRLYFSDNEDIWYISLFHGFQKHPTRLTPSPMEGIFSIAADTLGDWLYILRPNIAGPAIQRLNVYSGALETIERGFRGTNIAYDSLNGIIYATQFIDTVDILMHDTRNKRTVRHVDDVIKPLYVSTNMNSSHLYVYDEGRGGILRMDKDFSNATLWMNGTYGPLDIGTYTDTVKLTGEEFEELLNSTDLFELNKSTIIIGDFILNGTLLWNGGVLHVSGCPTLRGILSLNESLLSIAKKVEIIKWAGDQCNVTDNHVNIVNTDLCVNIIAEVTKNSLLVLQEFNCKEKTNTVPIVASVVTAIVLFLLIIVGIAVVFNSSIHEYLFPYDNTMSEELTPTGTIVG